MHRLTILLFFLLPVIAQAETWTSLYGGPHCRNASAVSITEPRISWSKHLLDFPSANCDLGLGGRTCNTPLIRDGKIWIIEPTGKMDLSQVGFVRPTEVGIYSLKDGSKIGGYQVPIVTSTVCRTNAGVADTDMVSGVFWAMGPNNSIIATTGGDWSSRNVFDADTGAPITHAGITNSKLGMGSNSSAAFAVSPGSQAVIIGTNQTHDIYSSAGMFRIDGKGWLGFLPQYKHWNIGLIDDATKGMWTVGISNDTVRQGYSTYVMGGVLSDTDPTGFESFYDAPFRVSRPLQGRAIPDWHVYSRYVANGFNAPPPFCLTDSGKIALLCHRHVAGSHTPDFSKGSALIVLDPKTKTGNRPYLPAVQPYAEIAESFRIEMPSVIGSQRAYLQIATRGKYLVAFFPPGEGQSKMICFDLEAKNIAWQTVFDPRFFNRGVGDHQYDNFPLNSVLQVKIAGDSAIVFEPSYAAEKLNIRLVRFALADGKQTESTLSVAAPNDIRADRVAVRDVAVVDGTALAMVQWKRQNKAVSQTLIAITGASVPPPEPVFPREYQEVLDFSRPRLPGDKYAEIESILRR